MRAGIFERFRSNGVATGNDKPVRVYSLLRRSIACEKNVRAGPLRQQIRSIRDSHRDNTDGMSAHCLLSAPNWGECGKNCLTKKLLMAFCSGMAQYGHGPVRSGAASCVLKSESIKNGEIDQVAEFRVGSKIFPFDYGKTASECTLCCVPVSPFT
jgi:hypothetical protein